MERYVIIKIQGLRREMLSTFLHKLYISTAYSDLAPVVSRAV